MGGVERTLVSVVRMHEFLSKLVLVWQNLSIDSSHSFQVDSALGFIIYLVEF